ncbi:MAG: hypothetical protein ACYC8T_01500 [Myxococcaceae bacterium]
MSAPDADPTGLSPRLDALLGQIPDRGYAGKLRKVYLAAAQAIHRLSDIDLVKYETSSTEGAPDLSLWEEMAPVIRDTVVDVNSLLMVIREQFPAHPPGGLGDTLSRALEEAGANPAGSAGSRQTSEAEAVLQSGSQGLAQEITHLGERMRSPAVVSDRWNLLSDLQSFRARFREEIGTLVFATASAFGDVHKRDVVPFYKLELETALAVRGTVSDLARIMGARLERIKEAEPEDVQWNAQQLEKELDTFGRTPAYRALRAQDKRVVIELRHDLGKVAIRPNPAKSDLVVLVEPFAAFIAELNNVNKRDMILLHDREVCAACGVRLEGAQQALARDEVGAATLFGEAVAAGQALYGRAAELDSFLRKARKSPVATLRGAELKAALERLMGLLAGLQLY